MDESREIKKGRKKTVVNSDEPQVPKKRGRKPPRRYINC